MLIPNDLMVSEVVLDGNRHSKPGMSVKKLMEFCERNLAEARSTRAIPGQIIFKGNDGKCYSITTKCIIVETASKAGDEVGDHELWPK